MLLLKGIQHGQRLPMKAGAEPARQFLDGAHPVSYTHLEQVSGEGGNIQNSVLVVEPNIGLLIEGAGASVYQTVSVSYTHLDVYKRQSLLFQKFFFLGCHRLKPPMNLIVLFKTGWSL